MKFLSVHCVLFLSSCALFAACSSMPAVTTFYWKGEKVLNVNSKNSSTPVNVRIYQLKESDKFVNASFDALLNDGNKALDGSNVGSYMEAVITQEKMEEQVIHIRPEVKFIGIMGLFSDTESDGAWKKCVPLAEFASRRFVFRESEISTVDR